eukprot:9541725-Alexandrium_andersonii.AAC.1
MAALGVGAARSPAQLAAQAADAYMVASKLASQEWAAGPTGGQQVQGASTTQHEMLTDQKQAWS